MLFELPREVVGFESVESLVIDDGSTDETVNVARAHGVDHVICFETNRGLATAFMTGLEVALRLGTDVIVNTDADSQDDAACIPDLVPRSWRARPRWSTAPGRSSITRHSRR